VEIIFQLVHPVIPIHQW